MNLDKHILAPLLILKGDSPKTLEEYKNEKFYIATGDLGFGMFAQCDIGRGSIIYVFGGPLIDLAETKRRGERECMPIQIDHDTYIDTMVPGCYVNHSCSPNAGIANDYELVALRPIKAGEEIRFDYSTTMLEQSFTMECRCGKPNCRHLVSDFTLLPPKCQRNYLQKKVVMSYIMREFGEACLRTLESDNDLIRL
jgi:hypothetical protein